MIQSRSHIPISKISSNLFPFLFSATINLKKWSFGVIWSWVPIIWSLFSFITRTIYDNSWVWVADICILYTPISLLRFAWIESSWGGWGMIWKTRGKSINYQRWECFSWQWLASMNQRYKVVMAFFIPSFLRLWGNEFKWAGPRINWAQAWPDFACGVKSKPEPRWGSNFQVWDQGQKAMVFFFYRQLRFYYKLKEYN